MDNTPFSTNTRPLIQTITQRFPAASGAEINRLAGNRAELLAYLALTNDVTTDEVAEMLALLVMPQSGADTGDTRRAA